MVGNTFGRILCCVLSLQLAAGTALGQGIPPGPGTQVEGGQTEDGAYKLTFNNESLQVVLQAYGSVTGRTPLVDPGAKAGNITLRSQGELSRGEYLDAIEVVLSMHGVALIESGKKFVKVVPIKKAQKESLEVHEKIDEAKLKESVKMVSQLIPLRHITTKEAQSAINALKHDYAAVQAFERTNSILVTDTAENVSRIIRIVRYLDQPLERREEHHIIPIQHAKASEIKQKLEEIIKETKGEEEKSTVPRLRKTGAPGVQQGERKATTARGVIRPPREGGTEAETPAAVEEIIAEAERGVIRGVVHIIADDRTNVLIIITRPENMVFFEKIVSVLDVETAPDVLVKVLRLEYAEAETVAKTLNTLIGKDKEAARPAAAAAEQEGERERGAALREYVESLQRQREQGEAKSKVGELSAADIKILPDERTNSLLIMASKGDLATLQEIVEKMDMMLPQVLIEAVIIQVDLNNTIQSGIQWVQKALIAYEEDADGTREVLGAFAGSAGAGSGDVLPGFAEATDLTTLGNWATGSGLTTYFSHFGLNLSAIVRLVSTDSRAKILSAPVIVTTDNTEGVITASEQRYFLKGSTVDQFGNVRPQTEIKDIGLNLTVTPHINKSRNVMMEISQEISDPGPEQQIEGQGSFPTMQKRSFNSSIAVQDRETIILGGLVRNSSSRDRRKVPLLGDIPLLGNLFRFNSVEDLRGEVVVFITPYVLDDRESIAAESFRRKESLSIEGIWKRGWSDSKLSENGDVGREFDENERLDGRTNDVSAPARNSIEGREIDSETMEFIRSLEDRTDNTTRNVD